MSDAQLKKLKAKEGDGDAVHAAEELGADAKADLLEDSGESYLEEGATKKGTKKEAGTKKAAATKKKK